MSASGGAKTAPCAMTADACMDALEAAGLVAFRWDARADALSFAGAAEALGLAGGPVPMSWAAFVDRFAAPDRAGVDRARVSAGDARVVTLARLTAPGGDALRVRLRAAWTDASRCVLTGVLAPAYGAPGETAEREADGRLDLEVSLRFAVEHSALEAWYQPIIALGDDHAAGLEALVRWPCPQRGVLPPDDFLPMAEELGLTRAIGRWMRAETAARFAAWRAELPAAQTPSFVAVNAAAHEIEDDGLAEEVAGLIAQWALPPRAFKVEVTESEVMRDPEAANRQLKALKEAGAALALDDFGAGFSSLAWLERFPFDTVKIDRYFIRTLSSSKGSRHIVSAVTKLAHTLGMSVVAEGVESQADADRLAEAGCDFGQGFWFAPPLTAAEARRFLTGESVR